MIADLSSIIAAFQTWTSHAIGMLAQSAAAMSAADNPPDPVFSANGLAQFGEACVSIFAIVNPIGNLPVFLGLTENIPMSNRRRLLRLASLVALAVLCVMAVCGKFLLQDVFHIGIEEFMFGGGVLLIVVGVKNVLADETRYSRLAKKPSEINPAEVNDQSIRLAVTPMACPLLVGPGAMVTVMLIVSKYGAAYGNILFGAIYGVAACAATFAVVMLILNYADVLFRIMGPIGSLIIGRLMQIFIVAIGVHFAFKALTMAFPAFARAGG
ncbi:MAG: MarC family protein [Planctomycetes bacterium]|nr:MarC family protein [Planctomycetota bacterium]